MYLINARQDGINGNAFAKTERVYNLSEGMQLKLIDETKLFKRIEQKSNMEPAIESPENVNL